MKTDELELRKFGEQRMKKSLVIILVMVCVLNLLACSGEKTVPSSETDGMLTEAEIEAIFGTLHREKQEEKTGETGREISAGQNQSEPAVAETETVQEEGTEAAEMAETSLDGIPIQYSHLFENGDFDENRVWTGYDDEYAELIEELFTFCEENVVGSVMLAGDEDVFFAGGFNANEIDEETRVNPFTTYEIGSLTQSFTAAAIIQQIQAGNLSASDTLDKFFPDYPHGSKISVDNLLHMDSGIPDYVNESMKFFAGRTAEQYEAFMNGQMEDEVILDFMNKSELVFEPGKKSKDSNTNYYLLALILEQVTGMTYEDYVQAYLLDVCGLENTTCAQTGDLTSVPQGNGTYQTTGRVGRGAFDMHSNVCDILMWDRELMAGRIIDEEHLEYMTQVRNEYACGWFGEGENFIGQWGNTGGYLCINFVYRMEEENLYLIMMMPDGKKWPLPGKTTDILERYLE